SFARSPRYAGKSAPKLFRCAACGTVRDIVCFSVRKWQMQLGMIGLGRMGANMAIRLMKAGHECIVHDSHADLVHALVEKGAKGSAEVGAFVKELTKPRAIWLMVPAGAVDPVLRSLTPLLDPGDIVIDGGNSYYQDDIRRAARLRELGIH